MKIDLKQSSPHEEIRISNLDEREKLDWPRWARNKISSQKGFWDRKIEKMSKELTEFETDPYSLFIFAINSPSTREKSWQMKL